MTPEGENQRRRFPSALTGGMKALTSQMKRSVLAFGCLAMQAFLCAGAFGAVVCVKPPVGANSTPNIVAAVGRLADGDVLRFAEGELLDVAFDRTNGGVASIVLSTDTNRIM